MKGLEEVEQRNRRLDELDSLPVERTFRMRPVLTDLGLGAAALAGLLGLILIAV